jgi:hypothetical protein
VARGTPSSAAARDKDFASIALVKAIISAVSMGSVHLDQFLADVDQPSNPCVESPAASRQRAATQPDTDGFLDESSKTIGYWVTTALVALAFLAGGAGDLSRGPDMLAGMAHLGYPAYLLVLLGVWKIVGRRGPSSPPKTCRTLKEWAYAGIVFDLTGGVLLARGLGGPRGRRRSSSRW